MIPVSAVCAEARKLLHTPYQHQARQPGRGADCIGIVVLVGRALKCCGPDFDITNYPAEPHNGMLVRLLDAHLQQLKGPTVGAIIAMHWARETQHVGIIVNPMHLVHAYSPVGRCVENAFSAAYQKRTDRYYAFPGVEYPPELLLQPVAADLTKPLKLDRA